MIKRVYAEHIKSTHRFMLLSLCAAVLILALFGFSGVGAGATHAGSDVIHSYRDIPGITAEETAAIESILSERQSFTFGSIPSLDAFILNGEITGFSPRLCEHLTNLFGVPFIPVIRDHSQLVAELNSNLIDFTASINHTAGIEHSMYKTSPIAAHRLSVFVKEGSREIVSEYDLRGLNVGFFSGSATEEITRNSFPRVDFNAVAIDTEKEMAEMLLSGDIDAFIFDTSDIFSFYEYDYITAQKDFPNIYVPMSISAANPELAPIINAITKYLIAGGIDTLHQFYDISEHEYAVFVFDHLLTDSEREYIAAHSSADNAIPFGATSARYPVAFFDPKTKEFSGIALDVLAEISTLTGLKFYPNCDETTTWRELEGMLKEGDIALLSQLIPNDSRREFFIWPDTHYFSARYALLSNIDFPFLSIDQVPYATVGFAGGTAEEAMYNTWFPEDTGYKTFTFSDEGLDALEKGEIDLFFSLDYTLLYESNYRENANQKINILFDSPVEKVLFGLNKDEEILCSVISKAQRIISTDKIVRSWTSRIVDQSAIIATERARSLMIFASCLLMLIAALSLFVFKTMRLQSTLERQTLATQQSNEMLQTILDMLPVGIIIMSQKNGELLYVNNLALTMYNVKDFEKAASERTGFDFVPELQPDGRNSFEIISDLWKSDKGTAEMQCLKPDGEKFWVRIAYCVINYNGINAALNAVEDMTAEREYQHMLKEIAQKEQDANQLKTRFLANMSHEVRTPMNAILGITEIQLQKGNLSSDTEEALCQIYESGCLLLNIINDILDLSKIEAGKLEIVPVKYDLPSLINDSVQTNRLRYDNKPVVFRLSIDENTPLNMYGDVLRLKQILNNILSNAFKYTDSGEVRLDISFTHTDGDNVILIFTISDTGQGMTEEQLGDLFSEYTRFNLEANRDIIGTGLGMSITKIILDLMNGEIDVTSAVGKGTVFTVRVPQKRVDSLVCGSDMAKKLRRFNYNSKSVSRRSRIKREYIPYGSVLVVDDVESNIFVAKGMLEPYGLKVEVADSGFAAIELVEKGAVYDIIFMDHMMPKMDGMETTKKLRKAGYNGNIIALTANALIGQAETFLENGFDGFLSKPINTEELDAVLKTFIRDRKPRDIIENAHKEQSRRTTKKTPTAYDLLPKEKVEMYFARDAKKSVSTLLKLIDDTDNFNNFDDKNKELYITTVHGIKSALLNINKKETSQTAKTLEQAANERNLSFLRKETPVFIETLKALYNDTHKPTLPAK